MAVTPSRSDHARELAWPETLRLLPGYDPFRDTGGAEFRADVADYACDFFAECLTHTKGSRLAGQSFHLLPWQRAVIGNLFGWFRADGTRRYRHAFIYVPRKNGKTQLAAGLVCLVFFCDDEPGFELFSAAGDREQAAIIYDHVAAMMRADPELRRRCRIFGGRPGSVRSILPCDANGELNNPGAFYRVLSADAFRQHGLNVHLAVIDETHTQRTPELVEALESGVGARTSPLVVHLSTADYDRPSICNERLDYARAVLDGTTSDPSFLPVIYEAPQGCAIDDEEIWAACNPSLGHAVTLEYLREAAARAKRNPRAELGFRRLHLNQKTRIDVAWLGPGVWARGAQAVDLDSLRGAECFGGLDLASRTDVAAWVMLFPPSDDRDEWVVLPRFFVPRATAVEYTEHRDIPYLAWAAEGHLIVTGGNPETINYSEIRDTIIEDSRDYRIVDVGADRWNLGNLEQQLQVSSDVILTEYEQTVRAMTDPIRQLEHLLLLRRLVHGNHPVLAWMIANVVIFEDHTGFVKFDRKRSRGKIDGAVALAMAMGRAMFAGHIIELDDEPGDQDDRPETRPSWIRRL